jgi:hypothetical protein
MRVSCLGYFHDDNDAAGGGARFPGARVLPRACHVGGSRVAGDVQSDRSECIMGQSLSLRHLVNQELMMSPSAHDSSGTCSVYQNRPGTRYGAIMMYLETEKEGSG